MLQADSELTEFCAVVFAVLSVAARSPRPMRPEWKMSGDLLALSAWFSDNSDEQSLSSRQNAASLSAVSDAFPPNSGAYS